MKIIKNKLSLIILSVITISSIAFFGCGNNVNNTSNISTKPTNTSIKTTSYNENPYIKMSQTNIIKNCNLKGDTTLSYDVIMKSNIKIKSFTICTNLYDVNNHCVHNNLIDKIEVSPIECCKNNPMIYTPNTIFNSNHEEKSRSIISEIIYYDNHNIEQTWSNQNLNIWNSKYNIHY